MAAAAAAAAAAGGPASSGKGAGARAAAPADEGVDDREAARVYTVADTPEADEAHLRIGACVFAARQDLMPDNPCHSRLFNVAQLNAWLRKQRRYYFSLSRDWHYAGRVTANERGLERDEWPYRKIRTAVTPSLGGVVENYWGDVRRDDVLRLAVAAVPTGDGVMRVQQIWAITGAPRGDSATWRVGVAAQDAAATGAEAGGPVDPFYAPPLIELMARVRHA